MLDPKVEVDKMTVVRDQSIVKRLLQVLEWKRIFYLGWRNPATMKQIKASQGNLPNSFAQGATVHFVCKIVRPDWLQHEKSAHKPSPDAPWVSTNDLVVSWFFSKAFGRTLCMGQMGMNLRNRLAGFDDTASGNCLT